VNGRHYHDWVGPFARLVPLEARRYIRRSLFHLRMLAQTNHIPKSRVEEMLDLVGLSAVALQLVGNFSLGMGQRLGIAEALLGDLACCVRRADQRPRY